METGGKEGEREREREGGKRGRKTESYKLTVVFTIMYTCTLTGPIVSINPLGIKTESHYFYNEYNTVSTHNIN